MIFISDVQNYISMKLCITGTLRAENTKIIKDYLWDTLEIDWKEVTVTFKSNKIDLPRVAVIKLQGKFKVR